MAVMYAPGSPLADTAAWDKAQRLLASSLSGFPHVHPQHSQTVVKGGSETRSKTDLARELNLMQQPFKDAAVESAQLAAFDKILAHVAPELQTIIKTAVPMSMTTADCGTQAIIKLHDICGLITWESRPLVPSHA